MLTHARTCTRAHRSQVTYSGLGVKGLAEAGLHLGQLVQYVSQVRARARAYVECVHGVGVFGRVGVRARVCVCLGRLSVCVCMCVRACVRA